MGYVSSTYGNKTSSYTIKVDKPVYKKLKDLYTENGEKTVYTLRALFLAKNVTHPHPVAVLEPDIFVDLPNHLMENVKNWRNDAKLTDLINKGLVGVTIYTYEAKDYGKKICYSIDLVDIEDKTTASEDDLPFEVE